MCMRSRFPPIRELPEAGAWREKPGRPGVGVRTAAGEHKKARDVDDVPGFLLSPRSVTVPCSVRAAGSRSRRRGRTGGRRSGRLLRRLHGGLRLRVQ